MTSPVPHAARPSPVPSARPQACEECIWNASALSGLCGGAACSLREEGEQGLWPEAWGPDRDGRILCARHEPAFVDQAAFSLALS